MFKNYKENRLAKQEAKEREELVKQISSQQKRVDDIAAAHNFSKLEHQVDKPQGVTLKKDETIYLLIEGVGLVEPRRGPSKWVGGSQGVSFRVAKGVSYRVGGSRGHLVQGEEKPTLIDTGLGVITNQRILFIGQKRSTEWSFAKLLGFSLDDDQMAIFNVSNRQKASGLLYGATHDELVDAAISAAVAKYTSPEEHSAVVANLSEALQQESQKLQRLKARL